MSGLRNHGGNETRRGAPRLARFAVAIGTVAIAAPAGIAEAAPVVPSAPSSPSAPSAAKASSLKYTVLNGDYLWGIAIKLGVSFIDLLTVNSFTMDTVIHPGQTVVVPEGGNLPPTPGAPSTPAAAQATGPYVVVSGDSLSSLAQRMGVTLPALLKANELTIDSVIHPGTTLEIPAGGHLPAPKDPVAGQVDSAGGQPATGQANGGTAAPAGTPPPNTPSAPAGSTAYTVVAGDYLVGIAERHGVTLKALLAANGLITTSAIIPGQQLAVPPATLPIPPAPDTPDMPDTQGQGQGQAPGEQTDTGGPSASEQSIATVIAFLQAQVGKPYAFNTAGPDTYDCSGLVSAAYDQIGISLPHQSLLQSMKGTAVDWNNEPLLPGDLIFQYSSANPTVIGHVGIVIDSTHWIQAAGSGTPVKIGPLPSSAKIRAVRRIVQR